MTFAGRIAALRFGVVTLVTLAPGIARGQCAMCRTALDSPEAKRLVAALFNGTILLLVVPMVAVATVAWVAIRDRRRLAEIDRD